MPARRYRSPDRPVIAICVTECQIDIWAGLLSASGTIPAQLAERHDSRPVRAAAPDRVDRGYWSPFGSALAAAAAANR
jgi:hypothetical protein